MPQYYCHRCRQSFDVAQPTQNCTSCNSDFLELVNRQNVMAAGMPPGTVQALNSFAELLHHRLRDEEEELPPRVAAGGDPAAAEVPQPGNGRDLAGFINELFRAAPQNRAPRGDGGNPSDPIQISFQIPGGVAVQINAHRGGNIGGAADRNGLEQMMEQLVNTLTGDGASMGSSSQGGFNENDVKMYVPMTKVTQEHVNNSVQCTTCFDTFKLGDDVGILDCKHIFHRPCIDPWLVNKKSCPVCRQDCNMAEWKRQHVQKAQQAVLEDLD